MKKTEITLEVLSKVLIRSFWLGLAFVTVWFFLFLALGDLSYGIHQGFWTGLTRHQFDLVNLCAIGLFKLGVFGLFLLPYLAIRLLQRSAAE